MKSTSILFMAACALSTTIANAGVTVTFTLPDNYTDMPFDSYDKDRVMKDLQQHFGKLAATLPAGQELKVDVLDIDLAGRIEPRARTAHDLRILRGTTDWPAITLRYTLELQGKVLKTGEDRLTDMAYLMGFNHYNSGESLRYEKRMLDQWFKKTLVAAKSGA